MQGQIRITALAVLLGALAPAVAFSQARPDAGRALEDSRIDGGAPAARPAPRLDLQQPVRPALSVPDTFRVLVKEFRITRTTVFTEDELRPLLAGFVGRELGFKELEQAAAVISRYYRERGYFVARAYLPAQKITDGIVEITVLEGRIGSYNIKLAPGSRAREESVRGILSAQLPAGSPLLAEKLERGLLLLNDTPGISAQARLAPGAEVGTTEVTVETADTALATGGLDADNYGNRFTGAARIGGTAYLNNPSGRGDLGTLRLQKSSGIDSARLAYQVPLGHDGFRLGATYSAVRYTLCCDFAALGASGKAGDFSVTGQYPFVRSRDFNLSGSVTGAGRNFFNSVAAGTTSDKSARVFVFGLSADRRDDIGGGGLNGLSVASTGGRLNLDGWAADRAADALAAQAHGGYSKLNYSLTRVQRLGSTTSVYAALSGQIASKNLDSSEQFALGGPFAVRAYPTGEAIGDEGRVLNLEWRWQFAANWQFAAFADQGRIRLHRNEWPGWQGANARIVNRYSLSGAGLGLNYSSPGNFTLRAFWANKLGSNPGQSVDGKDSDGHNDHARFWLQLVKYL